MLTPNQQVVFWEDDTRLVKSLINEPALLKKAAQKQSFAFKRTPIAEVFGTLEQAYSIMIIFDEERMKVLLSNRFLIGSATFRKSRLICHTINARYDQLDGISWLIAKAVNSPKMVVERIDTYKS